MSRDLLAIERSRKVRRRCAGIEDRFYEEVKKTWGSDAFVGAHPTWHAIDPIALLSQVQESVAHSPVLVPLGMMHRGVT